MKPKFILLTRLVAADKHPAFSLEEKAHTVKKKIAEYCPDVAWTASYATLGAWNYVDIFETADIKTAMKVATLVRHYGGAHTEIWPAVEWDGYQDILRDLGGLHA